MGQEQVRNLGAVKLTINAEGKQSVRIAQSKEQRNQSRADMAIIDKLQYYFVELTPLALSSTATHAIGLLPSPAAARRYTSGAGLNLGGSKSDSINAKQQGGTEKEGREGGRKAVNESMRCSSVGLVRQETACLQPHSSQAFLVLLSSMIVEKLFETTLDS